MKLPHKPSPSRYFANRYQFSLIGKPLLMLICKGTPDSFFVGTEFRFLCAYIMYISHSDLEIELSSGSLEMVPISISLFLSYNDTRASNFANLATSSKRFLFLQKSINSHDRMIGSAWSDDFKCQRTAPPHTQANFHPTGPDIATSWRALEGLREFPTQSTTQTTLKR